MSNFTVSDEAIKRVGSGLLSIYSIARGEVERYNEKRDKDKVIDANDWQYANQVNLSLISNLALSVLYSIGYCDYDEADNSAKVIFHKDHPDFINR